MTIVRNNQQLALNDLFVAGTKTADHYRDAADFLGSLPPSQVLRGIASERDKLVQRLEQAVRASEDLPSVPDEDRESVEKLFHRVHASLSDDQIKDILQQRLDAEEEFARIVTDIREAGWMENEPELLADVDQHIQSAKMKLRELMGNYPV